MQSFRYRYRVILVLPGSILVLLPPLLSALSRSLYEPLIREVFSHNPLAVGQEARLRKILPTADTQGDAAAVRLLSKGMPWPHEVGTGLAMYLARRFSTNAVAARYAALQ